MKRDQQSECGGCGTEERLLLHNVRHRATYRRLCTNCLLKNHGGLFCPLCFHVYEESLPPHDRLMCLKCPSISHLSCVPSSHPNASPSFLCPACSDPNFSFFRPASLSNNEIKLASEPNHDHNSSNNHNDGGGVGSAVVGHNDGIAIDKGSARALVAATKIAAISMTRAAAVARVEAERRVKEAALAKKRAREALERLTYLTAKEKETKDRDSKGTVMVSVKDSVNQHKVNNHNKRIQADGLMGIEHSRNGSNKGSNGVYPVAKNPY